MTYRWQQYIHKQTMVPLTTTSFIGSVTAVMDSITAVVGVHTLMPIGTLELIGSAVVHYNRQTCLVS